MIWSEKKQNTKHDIYIHTHTHTHTHTYIHIYFRIKSEHAHANPPCGYFCKKRMNIKQKLLKIIIYMEGMGTEWKEH